MRTRQEPHAPAGGAPVRVRARVTGVVQGVGFRPFVATLAARLGLAGFVGNDTAGVLLEAEGPPEAVAALLEALRHRPPPLARVEAVRTETLPPTGQAGFAIAPSDPAGPRAALVAADTATCDACLAEVRDPADRRFGYAFGNCTHCGPRYTIVRDVPYDRGNTTMAGFPPCPACRREYDDPADRRFHAQPVCCPSCGPRLTLLDPAGGVLADEDPLGAAAALLRAGRIVAVKGLGGYHLAVDCADERAVARLRAAKHREERPLAVLVADLATAGELAELEPGEAEALGGPARPIVLVRRRPGAPLAPSVAPGQRSVGLMLPYTPLHHLLAAAVGRPLVLTSGNVSDEPIAYRDDDALARLGPLADALLVHDRPIHTRVDDSVVRVVGGRPSPVRRSRGYVPNPIALPWPFPRHVLAVGAELKNTFCLGRDSRAFVSHHIGDLENHETLESFVEGIGHLCRLFAVRPEVVAHDLHPQYLSTGYALDLPDVELVGVQHHHAHVASCLADSGLAGPVIGVAFDGTGMGEDATLWGGEFLLADLCGYTRAAHLEPVPMPGGAAAIRQPWRMAAAYLDRAYPEGPPPLAVAGRAGPRWDQVRAAAAAGLNAPLTSSMGRLFDAVSALLGVRDTVSYEGQAAIELEQLADPAEPGAYPAGNGPDGIRGSDLVRAAAEDLRAGVGVPVISARFHNGVADLVLAGCRALREQHGLATVALSGGVWQNVLLLQRCTAQLSGAGFAVLSQHQVPCNDGGISLGQATVAAARDRARRG